MDLKMNDLKKIVEEYIEKPKIMKSLRKNYNSIRYNLDFLGGSDPQKRDTAIVILKNFIRELETDVMRD